MTARRFRCGVVAMALALGATLLTAVAPPPAGALPAVAGGYATTTGWCNGIGFMSYTGAGFHAVRVSRFDWGVGVTLGQWNRFVHNWDDSPVLVAAYRPGGPSTFALYAEFAVYQPVEQKWYVTGEWVMQGSSYWCRA